MFTKKNFKIVFYLLILLLVLIQFFPSIINESGKKETTDFFEVYPAPKQIISKIKESCYDCHSNHTRYPWYNKIQPIAFLLQDHIEEAKEELNFSEFANYSKRKKKSKLKSISNEIKDDKMPLWTYTLMHKDAKFSKEEKVEIVKWIDGLIE